VHARLRYLTAQLPRSLPSLARRLFGRALRQRGRHTGARPSSRQNDPDRTKLRTITTSTNAHRSLTSNAYIELRTGASFAYPRNIFVHTKVDQEINAF